MLEYFLRKGTPLPQCSWENPLLSVAMRHVVACCTGLDRKTRQKMHNLVRLMGGAVSGSLTDAVTHLITGDQGEPWTARKCVRW